MTTDDDTGRIGPLLRQYEFALERTLARLDGLSDAEYLWEPAPGAWSVRARAEARTSETLGSGAWVLEREPRDPQPPPFTTLAWRICHLANHLRLRADYTIGSRAADYRDYRVQPTAAAAVADLREAGEGWRQALVTATDEVVDQVGRSSYPAGLDPTLPFIEIAWWVNQEVLHHGGEMGVLRDLWFWTQGAGSQAPQPSRPRLPGGVSTGE